MFRLLVVLALVCASAGCGDDAGEADPDAGGIANSAPTIDVSDTCIAPGATSTLPLVVEDAETDAPALIVSASSADEALIPNENIALASDASGWVMTLTPAAEATSGTVPITLTASDGALSASSTIDVTLGGCTPVVINEVMFADTGGPDWIEIYNADAGSMDISGWVVSDTGFYASDAYVFPEGTILEPGEYVTLHSNLAPSQDWEFAFDLSSSADSVMLYVDDGAAVDVVTWPPVDGWPFERRDAMSYGRIPNGSGDFQLLFDDNGGGGTPSSGTPASPGADGENVAVAFCGNGVTDQVAEACDDGNVAADDGCTACVVTPYCGNGVIDQEGEICDDGNDSTGDGCVACATEAGWACFRDASACYDVDETSAIVLNEVISNAGEASLDWVELHNVSGAAIAGTNLDGLCLTDDHQLVDPNAPPCNDVTACPDTDSYSCTSVTATPGVCMFNEPYELSAMADLPADGYLSLTNDDFLFGIGGSDAVFLYSSCDPGTATLIDVLDFEDLPDGQTFGRWTDADDVEGYYVMVIPTQDAVNELCGGDQAVPILESTEQCDDGNNVPGDGCDATCNIE